MEFITQHGEVIAIAVAIWVIAIRLTCGLAHFNQLDWDE